VPRHATCTHSSATLLVLQGRVLRGRILPEEPVVFAGLQELVEDENGDAIRVRPLTKVASWESQVEGCQLGKSSRGLPAGKVKSRIASWVSLVKGHQQASIRGCKNLKVTEK